MSKWITQRAAQMPLLRQATQIKCWTTCYQMILNATGINSDKSKIQKKNRSRRDRECRFTAVITQN